MTTVTLICLVFIFIFIYILTCNWNYRLEFIVSLSYFASKETGIAQNCGKLVSMIENNFLGGQGN